MKPALDLELMERLLMEDIGANIERPGTLRGLGATIAMDDFETGYSSLNYLAQLPMGARKNSRSSSTMVDLPSDQRQTTIVGSDQDGGFDCMLNVLAHREP